MLKKFKEKYNAMSVEVRASVAYMVCNILQRCMSFLTMPLFTRLMSAEEFGQFTVYSSWSSMLMIFLTLNMAYGSLNTALIRFEKDRVGYVSAIQAICVTLTGAFILLYLPFQNFWNTFLNMSTPLVILMAVEILSQFALTCWYTLKRFAFEYKGVVAVTLFVALCAPVLAVVLVLASQDKGVARILGYAGMNIAVGMVFFALNAARGRKAFSREYWKYALGFNIPLIPYYLSQVVFTQSDRVMIDHICGTGDAGLYGLAHTLSMMLVFVLNAVNNSYVPWFYGRIKEGRARENRPVANGIAALMAFMLMGVISLAPELIAILGGPEYARAAWVVPPVTMSLLLLFYAQLFINVEFYYEEKNLLVWGSIASAVLNVILNGLLIPRFGFVAAGYTTLVSYIVFALANYCTYRSLLKREGETKDAFDLKVLLLIFAGFTVLSFTAMALYEKPMIRYAIIAAVLTAVAVMHKPVIAYVKRVILHK